MSDSSREVIIIGSGPAGLTAALYTARANLKPLVIEGLEAGGQLMLTTTVENFPGFRDGVMGPELMGEMRAQAERFGAEIVQGNVTAISLGARPFTVETPEQAFQKAQDMLRAVIAYAQTRKIKTWLAVDPTSVPSVVPEPASWMSLAAGATAIAALGRRKRRRG